MMRRREDSGPLFDDALVNEIFRFFSWRQSDEHAAWDLVQETLFEAHRSRRRFDRTRGSFRTWVHGIARVVLLRQRERDALEAARVDPEVDPDAIEIPGQRETTAGSFTLETVAALGELTERDRTMVFRSSIMGQSTREIAADLGMTQTGVTSALSRIYRRMRKHLGGPQGAS